MIEESLARDSGTRTTLVKVVMCRVWIANESALRGAGSGPGEGGMLGGAVALQCPFF